MSNLRAISAAYLERKLRAICGVQGGNPLPELANLNGLIVIENDRPEWGFAGGELRYTRGLSIAAGGAGTVSIAALVNPTGSGVLVILEKVIMIGNSARWWANVTTIAGTRGFNKDMRQSRGDPLAAVNSVAFVTQSNTELPGTSGQDTGTYVRDNAVGPGVQDENWIVPPGSNIAIKSDANTALQVGYHWRERPIEGTVEVK